MKVSSDLCYVIIYQFLTGFFQSRSFGVGADTTSLQIFHPFFQRSDGRFIELIHPNQERLGKDFGREFVHQCIFLFGGYFKTVAGVHSDKVVLPVGTGQLQA